MLDNPLERTGRKRGAHWLLVGLLAIALTWGAGRPCLARAGGGQSYGRSGGSSWGGSRSSGSWGGSSSGHSSWGGSSGGSTYGSSGGSTYGGGGGSTYGGGGGGGGGMAGAVAGFLVLVVFAFVAVSIVRMLVQQGSDSPRMGEASWRPATPPPPVDTAAGLRQVQGTDPGFHLGEFLSWARHSFMQIQAAWQARDLETVRGCISEAVFRRFRMQLDELTAKHQRNCLESLMIDVCEAVRVTQQAGHDVVVVRFTAEAQDYTIDEQTGALVSGSRDLTPFTEYWTFVRTTPAPGSQAIRCPGCGADLPPGELSHCEYCGSEVHAERFDWVLDSISQELEAAEVLSGQGAVCGAASSGQVVRRLPVRPMGAPPDPADRARLTAADPMFDEAAFLDRAQTVFFAVQKALVRGRVDTVSRLVTAPMQTALDGLSPGAGRHLVMDDLVVGGASVVHIDSLSGLDRITVQFNASAADSVVGSDGSVCNGSRTPRPFSEFWTFVRPVGTSSQETRRSVVCSACGGSTAEMTRSTCAYCGGEVQPLSFTWTLDGMGTGGAGARPRPVGGGSPPAQAAAAQDPVLAAILSAPAGAPGGSEKRQCPVCQRPLRTVDLFDVCLDECHWCGGLWLDAGELQQLAALHRVPPRFLNPMAYDPAQAVTPEGQRPCPCCGQTLYVGTQNSARIEGCTACKGLWLDRGELGALVPQANIPGL